MKNLLQGFWTMLFAAALVIGMTGCPDSNESGSDSDILVTGVSLNKSTLSLTVGGNETLTATVLPATATNKAVTWSSSDTTKATVANGVVTAIAAGTATITVKTTDGNKTATCNVTVTAAVTGPNTPATPQAFRDITATALVGEMKIGWNLGNSLDAHGVSKSSTVTQFETQWGNPVTTQANITAIKNAGFNTIRIPVSWTQAATGAPNYTIRADWMARVVDVVNYAVSNDMYILLNTHHDEDVFTFMNSNAAAGKAAYQKIWEQIADTFKNYNEKLIFEGLNEPRTIGSAAEWSGGTAEERNNLNAYYPIFVNAVRNSGGNNAKRILMINTYAASIEQVAVDGLTLPADTASNKLIVSVHAYQPWYFCYEMGENKSTWSIDNPSDKSAVTTPIDRVYNKFVNNGTPVIIGEFGAMDKNNNLAYRAAWAEFYVSYALSKGIKCVVWDNGITVKSASTDELFGLFNRTTNVFNATMKEALMRGAENPGSGGDGEQEELGTLFGFEWNSNVGPDSTMTSSMPGGTSVKMSGTRGANTETNYAELQGAPDTATLTALKNMTKLKLTVQGDGNSYRVSFPTTDTASTYNHWGYTFSTTNGGTTNVSINIPGDLTPSWGAAVGSITKNNITGMQLGATGTGAFELTISSIEME